MDKYLIKSTTREHREQIVRESLDCGGGGCENCSACGAYGAIDPYVMYQPYIDGIKELFEITQEFSANYIR
ncbi:MAG TPA: hypothetical protein VN258_10440 [Mobilitalea sp.]|nr:hypothetical protein [Mobilitalea sp.]